MSLAQQPSHALPLGGQFQLVLLRRFEQLADQIVADLAGQALEQVLDVAARLIQRQAESQAEFGVVLEQRIAPGGAAPVRVDRVGRRGQIAAVDRRAAGGVADHHAVAKQLRHQFHVGRFTASRTRPGILEQRLENLRSLDRVGSSPACGRSRECLRKNSKFFRSAAR